MSGECAHWALGFFFAIALTGRGIFGGRPSGAGVYGQAGFLGAPGKEISIIGWWIKPLREQLLPDSRYLGNTP